MLLDQRVVHPAEIERELNRIWDSLDGKSKMRACLFNLIIYTSSDERLEYVRTVAQKVIEKFPSRILFICHDKNAKEDFLKTSVSVISPSKNDIVCDLIQIDVGGAMKKRIPFVILPHILPDLPVYLVWAEDPTQDDPLSNQLETIAARVIFDSETASDLPAFARTLLLHKEKSHTDIADLNWARMESWRQLIAATFSSQDRLSELASIKHLKISFNAHASAFFCHTLTQAIYLQGWLACQMNWEFKEMKNRTFFYTGPKGPIEVELIEESLPKLASGIIISVDILTTEDHHYAFRRNPLLPNHIDMTLCTLEKCEIPIQFVFTKAESGASLVKEIVHRGTSEHYLKLLHFIADHVTNYR